MKSINSNAPVKCSKSITINAAIGEVWSVLTGISNWTTWQTDISRSFLHGDLRPGSTFEWKSGGARIVSSIHTAEPFNSFGWTGKGFGLYAVHNWTLMEKNGSTIVTTEESKEGFIAGLLRKSLNSSLERGLQNWLSLLKQECEKQNLRLNYRKMVIRQAEAEATIA